MSDDPNYVAAKRHVVARKGFYIHLLVYLCVMAGLVTINIATKSDWWVQWPMLGWGIGVLGHAIGVFAPDLPLARNWEERKIKQRMAKR